MRSRIGGLRATLLALVLLVAPAQAQVEANAAAEALARHLRMATGATSERAAEDLVVLAQFYRARQMAPLWLDEEGPNARALALAEMLRSADEAGLDPEDYGASAITGRLARAAGRARAAAEPGPDRDHLRSGVGPARAQQGRPRAVRLSS
jgi:murein L,D-transpeptidase YcbB/YkuD